MNAAAAMIAPFLAARAAGWVERQRARHRGAAANLSEDGAARLAPWFGPETLARLRVRTVPRMDPPPGLGVVARLGLDLPLEFDRIWGMTFVDTVVLLERVPPVARETLLFHECVHVVQYRLLGVRGFLAEYVRGWLEAGRRYRDIPLEADAYDLARRFEQAPETPFAAEPEIARRLAARGWGAPARGAGA